LQIKSFVRTTPVLKLVSLERMYRKHLLLLIPYLLPISFEQSHYTSTFKN